MGRPDAVQLAPRLFPKDHEVAYNDLLLTFLEFTGVVAVESELPEVTMAKRRNLKKEKALRNEEYARRFRKRGQGARRRRMGGPRGPRPDGAADQEMEATDDTSAAATD